MPKTKKNAYSITIGQHRLLIIKKVGLRLLTLIKFTETNEMCGLAFVGREDLSLVRFLIDTLECHLPPGDVI